ncbi:MAG: hypothetical protein U0Y68_04035 [Blastocatellia bacterium]
MNHLYILKGCEPQRVSSVLEWGHWMEDHTQERIVARDQVRPGIEVSTVFLGLDHALGRIGRPILFETMIFGGRFDGNQNRYHTWDEAIEGHRLTVEHLFPLERVPRRWRARIKRRMSLRELRAGMPRDFQRKLDRMTSELVASINATLNDAALRLKGAPRCAENANVKTNDHHASFSLF